MTITDAVTDRLFPAQAADVLDPVGWIERELGERLWSKQREIIESVRDHRHTAVQSAHGIGKSYLAARCAAHWIATHPVGEAFAVTTAPTGRQVEAIIWRELGRAHGRGRLQGRITGGATPAWRIGPEIVAVGWKPQNLADPELAAAAFQGTHARYLLVVLDEAAGIPPWLWDGVESIATSEGSRVLAIGNPTDPISQFAEICKPGSGWNVIQVSAFDTPAFTGEPVSTDLLEVLVSSRWVQEREQRWGAGTPLYVSKVLGEFPDEAEDTLITSAMVRQAQELDLSDQAFGGPAFGVDVARSGSDESVIYSNRDGIVRREHAARGQDTMRTTGQVARLLRANREARATVDIVGVGAGVYDSLREQGLAAASFQGSERARDPERFQNRRAESYWHLREELAAGRMDLDSADEDLASQLLAIKWYINSRGRIQIESKDDMRKRGVPSPDRADAVAMTLAAKGGGGIYVAAKPTLAEKRAKREFDAIFATDPDTNLLEVVW